MQAMILAAGLGTRLQPYSHHRPKPLFPVVHTPLLQRILDQLYGVGVSKIVVNAHHLREQIAESLTGKPGVFVQLEETLLGTGGGLRLARGHFSKDPLLVVNGDIFHTIDLNWVVAEHVRLNSQATAPSPVTMVLHDFPRFGSVAVNQAGLITGFEGSTEPVPEETKLFAFTGIHVVDPVVLDKIPSEGFYNIIDYYRKLIAEGIPIRGLVVKNHFWSDIGTVQDYLDLHGRFLTQGKGDLLSSQFSKPFAVHSEAKVGDDVNFQDWVSIGARAVVESGARLARVVVWDGARVASNEALQDTIVI